MRQAPQDIVVGMTVALFFATSTVLAIWSLIRGVAPVACWMWLALVCIGSGSAIFDEGLRGFTVDWCGAFAREQVLVVRRGRLGIGYRLLGVNLIGQWIPAEDVADVYWSRGQTGWRVFIAWRRDPERALLTFGPGGAEDAMKALAPRIVSFLRDAGISVATRHANAAE